MLTKQKLKIVFMGTPDFAAWSLRKLVEGGYNVVGVVTMPDKPIGRHGSVLQPSPVKQYATIHNIPVLQPEKLKDEGFITQLRSLEADLQIVVAFRMLPEVVWGMPPLGTFNLHASLLPQYRGAAPINWAVINGDAETGITTFFLRHEIDTGDIIQQVRVPILPTDNAGDVHDKLMMLGGELVTETVDNIIAGTVKPIPQEEFWNSGSQNLGTSEPQNLRPAPKIFHETCRIDWNQPSVSVHNFVRGLSPYPAAWTTLNSTQVKIFETSVIEAEKLSELSEPLEHSNVQSSESFGAIKSDGRTYIHVQTSDGFVAVNTLQLAGKKRMPVEDFLRGFRFTSELRFV